MDKGILCTIDFSDSSKDALRWSVSLAKVLKTHLTVLYTYRLLNPGSGEVQELKKRLEEDARRDFAALEEEVLKGKGVKYQFKVEVGFVSNRVKEYAKKNDPSFIVMANKMHSGTEDSFDELSEKTQVPLVIVP
jgi:nucleotide-binding universal stress UspA family protein